MITIPFIYYLAGCCMFGASLSMCILARRHDNRAKAHREEALSTWDEVRAVQEADLKLLHAMVQVTRGMRPDDASFAEFIESAARTPEDMN